MKICFFPLLQPTPFPKFCFQVGPVSCYPSHLRSLCLGAWPGVVTAHLPRLWLRHRRRRGGRGKYGAGHVTLRHIWFLASLSSLTCS